MWDVGRFAFVTSYTGHTNWVRCVRFVKDEKLAVSCADDKTIKMWDTRSGQCVEVFTAVNGKLVKVFTRDNLIQNNAHTGWATSAWLEDISFIE